MRVTYEGQERPHYTRAKYPFYIQAPDFLSRPPIFIGTHFKPVIRPEKEVFMFRLIRGYRSVFIVMTVLAFLIAIPIEHALAALVYTQASETEPHYDHFRTRMNNLLAQEDVRVALLLHGINPTEVEARIAALTDDEVSQIRGRIGELPGGGSMAPLFPIWLVILILLGYILVITGVISLGAYTGVKIQEHQEEEYAKSAPFPAPPRVGTLPSVNPNEPWTGKWRVTEGQFRGVYCLQQNGDRVVSTSDSDSLYASSANPENHR
jgi:hypothetical protein